MERGRIVRIAEAVKEHGIKTDIVKIDGIPRLILGEGEVKMTFPLAGLEGIANEEIVKEIISKFENDTERDSIQGIADLIKDYDKVYDNIRIQLLPKEIRDAVLRRDFLDLVMVPSVHIGDYSTKVTKGLLKYWGITEDELFETAMWNTKKKVIIRDIADMTDILAERLNLPAEVVEMYQSARGTMWVMTTTDNYAGAAAMCMEGVFWSMANSLETDIIIIPSSRQELILIPAEEGIDKKYLYEMVREVNATMVEETGDKLSDTVYIYRMNKDKVEIL